jgi:microcystin-dependent protein
MLSTTEIIIVIIIVLLIFCYPLLITQYTVEHLTVPSNEALQTIASVYNTNNLTVTNATVDVLTARSIVASTINFLPRGIIVSWTGSVAPAGWALCDGNNGTPDLRGRFILGAGPGTNLTPRTLNDTGGAENHVLTVGEMPAHNHTGVIGKYDNCYGSGKCSTSKFLGTDWKTTDNTGGNAPHNNMPPYFVLAFIMKL